MIQDGDVPWKLPHGQNPYKNFPTSALDRDVAVNLFDGEKYVDQVDHKGEQVSSAVA